MCVQYHQLCTEAQWCAQPVKNKAKSWVLLWRKSRLVLPEISVSNSRHIQALKIMSKKAEVHICGKGLISY